MHPRARLAKELFGFMEHEGISYAVVGDTRNYPHDIESDLDIVVNSDAAPGLRAKLSEFCSLHEAAIVQVLQHEQTAWYFVISLMDNLQKFYFFDPDFCTDYFRHGRLFLKAEEFLSNRVPALDCEGNLKGFYIPAPAHGFIYYLLKKIDKGEFNDRHGDYLSSVWKKDPEGASVQLKRFWQEDTVNLLAVAASQNHWSEVRTALPQLRIAVRNQLPFSLKNWRLEVFRKIHRILEPTGLHVVFLGVDGSGKSTVLAEIQKRLAPAFRRTKRYHLRPFWGYQTQEGAPVINPHGQDVRGAFSSLIKIVWWWLDYTLGYLKEVFPKLLCSTLVLFDRYYYDLAVDARRYRYAGPTWLIRIVGKMIPAPDIVILLDAPECVIHDRKQEVSVEETARQRGEYLKLINSLKNGNIVDSALPLPEVVAQVEHIILDYLAARSTLRLGLGKC